MKFQIVVFVVLMALAHSIACSPGKVSQGSIVYSRNNLVNLTRCFPTSSQRKEFCEAHGFNNTFIKLLGSSVIYCCTKQPVSVKPTPKPFPSITTQNVVNQHRKPAFECFSSLSRRDGICEARGWNIRWHEFKGFDQIYCCTEKPNATQNVSNAASKADFECFDNSARRDGICQARGWTIRWHEFKDFNQIYCCAGKRECYLY